MTYPSIDKIPLLMTEIGKVILGKQKVVQLTTAAFLAGGHVLFEDIPGVGKTLMVKSFARAIHGSFSRIQFTPDMMPSDILGVSIFNEQLNQFEFHQGPIFTTVLLADEINRTTPRTQAALLEAMSEGIVTIDNHTYPLPANFFVLATQNPIDYEGTYPLLEAQLDRFLFRLTIGYPSTENELALMLGKKKTEKIVKNVLTAEDIEALKKAVEQVYMQDIVAEYALDLVKATRHHPEISLGISPRGSIAFVRAAKSYALTEGRTYVTPEDLQEIMPYVFGHRLILKDNFNNEGHHLDNIFTDIKKQVPVPVKRVTS